MHIQPLAGTTTMSNLAICDLYAVPCGVLLSLALQQLLHS